MQLTTLAQRIWYALHCLPRDKHGDVPSYRSLEAKYGLEHATISKALLLGRTPGRDKFRALARALNVTEEWLDHREGRDPIPTGDIPKPPKRRVPVQKTYGEVEGWEESITALTRARRLPPEAFDIGGAMRVYRRVDRVTPEIAFAVCSYAWVTATAAEQTKYSTRLGKRVAKIPPPPPHVQQECNGDAITGRSSRPPPPLAKGVA
jgi:hypothetical protein